MVATHSTNGYKVSLGLRSRWMITAGDTGSGIFPEEADRPAEALRRSSIKDRKNASAKMLKTDKKSYPTNVKNVEKLVERRIMTRLVYVRILPNRAADHLDIICYFRYI